MTIISSKSMTQFQTKKKKEDQQFFGITKNKNLCLIKDPNNNCYYVNNDMVDPEYLLWPGYYYKINNEIYQVLDIDDYTRIYFDPPIIKGGNNLYMADIQVV